MNTAETREALRQLGVVPEKGLGQNFLVNPLLAHRIASALEEPEGTVLEIGPGLGALTGALLARGLAVTAVEVSQAMCMRLRELMPEATVVQRDFLEATPGELPGFPFRAVASNLPYSISTPSLIRLCEPGFSHVARAVLMLQKEVALRLSCLEGGKDYGRLSLAVWPHYSVSVLFEAGPWEFYPRPEVESLVVLLKRKRIPPVAQELCTAFLELVKAAFSARRKKIVNNLARVYGKARALAILEGAGVDPDLRAERVPPESFAAMAEEVGS